MKKKGKLLAI